MTGKATEPSKISHFEGTIGFGINDIVSVKLNEDGRAIRDARWESLRQMAPDDIPENPQPVQDPEGRTKWLFWEFMLVFGPVIHQGGRLPFDGTSLTLTRMK